MSTKFKTKAKVDDIYFDVKPYKPLLSNFIFFPMLYLCYGHHFVSDILATCVTITLIWYIFIKHHSKYFKIGIMADRVDLYDKDDKVIKTSFFDEIDYVKNIHTDNYLIYMKSGESFNTGYIQADNDEIERIFSSRAVNFISKDIGSI